jgi:hypothetical protein
MGRNTELDEQGICNVNVYRFHLLGFFEIVEKVKNRVIEPF